MQPKVMRTVSLRSSQEDTGSILMLCSKAEGQLCGQCGMGQHHADPSLQPTRVPHPGHLPTCSAMQLATLLQHQSGKLPQLKSMQVVRWCCISSSLARLLHSSRAGTHMDPPACQALYIPPGLRPLYSLEAFVCGSLISRLLCFADACFQGQHIDCGEAGIL